MITAGKRKTVNLKNQQRRFLVNGATCFRLTCPTDINVVNKGLGCKNEQKLQI